MFADMIAASRPLSAKLSNHPPDAPERMKGNLFKANSLFCIDTLPDSPCLLHLPTLLRRELSVSAVSKFNLCTSAYIKTVPFSYRFLESPPPRHTERHGEDTLVCSLESGSDIVYGLLGGRELIGRTRALVRFNTGPVTGNYVFIQKFSPVHPRNDCYCKTCLLLRRICPLYTLNSEHTADAFELIPLSQLKHNNVQMIEVAHHPDMNWFHLNLLVHAFLHNDPFTLGSCSLDFPSIE
jgi:hypothetical protein